MGSMMAVPWFLAAATALWFGITAKRAERNSVLWSLGGGLFALVISTIVFGLGHAAGIPFSEQQRARLHVEWTTEAVVLIGILGWLFTLGLYRHEWKSWSPSKTGSSAPPPASSGGMTESPKAPPPPPKPS